MIIDRAAHPIQETARNLGPALLVVTFDAIFAFAALRFAKVPMIRDFGLLLAVGIAAICLVQHHRPARRSSASASTSRPPRAATSARARSAGSWCGSAACPPRSAPVLVVASLVIFAGGILVEDKLVAPDRPDPVGQPGLPGRSRTSTRSTSEVALVERARRSSSSRDDVFSDETVDVRRRLHRRAARATYPETLLTASSIVDDRQLPDRDPRRAATSRRPARTSRPRTTSRRRTSSSRRSTSTTSALNLIFRTGPGGLEDRAEVVREIRDTVDPPAGHHGHAVGARRRRRRPARQPRGEPDPAHLPGDPVRVPVPRRPAAQRRPVAAVARAGAHRRRARRRSSPTRSTSS